MNRRTCGEITTARFPNNGSIKHDFIRPERRKVKLFHNNYSRTRSQGSELSVTLGPGPACRFYLSGLGVCDRFQIDKMLGTSRQRSARYQRAAI
ncbi:hypothetical protein RRG08_024652 [Elysia crispata]|uniref:Uncharacterized protein n=1 Tax=Elysia crispata TaxID=231223 RepID=A0AAE1DNA6_9GAST|nr:hypothetical protein RRG08_024652 [Elysia crispata]